MFESIVLDLVGRKLAVLYSECEQGAMILADGNVTMAADLLLTLVAATAIAKCTCGKCEDIPSREKFIELAGKAYDEAVRLTKEEAAKLVADMPT